MRSTLSNVETDLERAESEVLHLRKTLDNGSVRAAGLHPGRRVVYTRLVDIQVAVHMQDWSQGSICKTNATLLKGRVAISDLVA